jgi:predicted metalloprotease with PDZ domain
MRAFVALLATTVFLATTAHAQDAVDAPIARYTVRHAGGDSFRVEATFAAPVSRLDLNSHDSSRKDAQAGSVHELAAFGADGKPVPIAFAGNGTWELKGGTASRIAYTLVADHDAHTWIAGKDEVATKFDASYFFAGDAFFLLDYDWPRRPVDVRFDLPAGWVVTAPWPKHGGDHRAPHVDNLGSNAFAMGRDAARSAQAGELRLTWLSDSRVAAIEPRLLPMFDKLPQVYGEFWGGAPGKDLTIFFLADPTTDGGAFHNSFAMRLATPLRPAEALVWEHTLGHELMHVWMNNSNDGLATAGDGTAYWLTEGFTDYLTVKLMRRAGLIDEALAAQRLANQVRRYQVGKRLSPGVTFIAAGKEKHKHWELIYGGGALMAMLLDAELSRESPDAFRDAVRRVQRTGRKVADGPGLLALLDEATNGRASVLMRDLDAGLKLDDLRTRLAPAGISVEGFASDEVYVAFGECADAPCPAAAWKDGALAH